MFIRLFRAYESGTLGFHQIELITVSDPKFVVQDHILSADGDSLKMSPSVFSMSLQRVKFIVKMSKYASLAQEIGFPIPNLCSLLWLVKGTT
jgi:hypothetical protein